MVTACDHQNKVVFSCGSGFSELREDWLEPLKV